MQGMDKSRNLYGIKLKRMEGNNDNAGAKICLGCQSSGGRILT